MTLTNLAINIVNQVSISVSTRNSSYNFTRQLKKLDDCWGADRTSAKPSGHINRPSEAALARGSTVGAVESSRTDRSVDDPK
jgi:predicted alpha/beta hydrolase family esterase